MNNTKEYLVSVYNELQKVHWPDRTQLIGYTGVVLFAVLIVGLIIWLFDSGLSFVLQKLFEALA
ncbi:preprotein translocase subunit SecE [Thermosyntropha sp.]|uniref:preprotein translocase subunit SecE n=1 Tax=Thermosyntropha sp. TaxID=2740820 RepID=UPI0025F48BCD|nr:preprotein translocase subunit SecE [Thermosyntropha sp.]MBO8158024.1 preprotein translocase subunit SecE [Thermosyntropha sp.]